MIKWDRLTLTGRLTNIYSKNVSKRTLVKAVALMAIDITFYFFATISFYYIMYVGLGLILSQSPIPAPGT